MAHSSRWDLTGRWVGHYRLHDEPHSIAADLIQSGDRLSGRMRDHVTSHECSVFQATASAGLPPGADEQITASLRELVPEAGNSPIRYIWTVPAESLLEGSVKGESVYFLKTYEGTCFGGYRVGEKLVGEESAAHSVHYSGQLDPDGLVIEGKWWIEANRERQTPRTEGHFNLRRG
jgi:hypothetical protein